MPSAAQEPGQHTFIDFPHDPWASALHAGVDEVGIGPLAGPVVAAAVLLDPNHPIAELADSKTLSSAKREQLNELIKERALSWALGWASVAEVDQHNVLQASHIAMQRACQKLSQTPAMVLVDGNKTPRFPMPCVAVVQGDKRIPQISAASIIAKVARDAAMVALEDEYPGYGFAKHKGYPTKAHMQALAEHGVTPVHRKSFAPVRNALASMSNAQTELVTG